ncbi:hypothetical protein [Methanospirillum lacunae]|uniref:Uncharacterized protein n=1 Tax=Methanospirillum lacunae TaxID=668570 RepID=A0A2V2MTD4_9EURY|nr:hypothetical protein [Methanospirillum lacunae]PWR71292.1 hypothetical protein DK846_10510 [Methanospirillum lacunae]
MTWEVISGVFGCTTVVNAVIALMMVRRYLALATSSMEFASLIVSSIEENEDGTISVNPLVLAATSMDHLSQLSGMLRWIRL